MAALSKSAELPAGSGFRLASFPGRLGLHPGSAGFRPASAFLRSST